MVNIGKIAGTHGYDGTVRVIPTGSHPERFKKLEKVTVAWTVGRKTKKSQEMKVENVRIPKNGNQVLIKLKEIPNKEEGQLYNGGFLQVPDEEVWPLPEGEYYYFQLEGLTVVDEEKGVLGTVCDILETGANDVYVVERENGKELLLPAIPQVIRKVDLEAKTLHIHLLPGLEDL